MMPLFQLGAFTLHSGALSRFKIDCDALTEVDLETIAFLLARKVAPFGAVEGVPTGGDRLAAKMSQYVTPGADGLLIVDDVCTTGGSLEAHRAGRRAEGAVIIARGNVPAWVRPLLVLQV